MKTKILYYLIFLFIAYSCSTKESVTPSISLSQNELMFSCNAETKNIEIKSTHSYIIYSVPDWITVNNMSGDAGINNLEIETLVNQMDQIRTATLVVSIFDGDKYFTANIKVTQSAADKNQIDGEETIFNVSKSNLFSNGDKVSFENINQIHAVTQVRTASGDIESLGEIRDFYFNFQVIPSSFQFVVSMKVPEKGWKLCKFENEVWNELQDVYYDNDSIKIPLTLNFSSIVQSQTKVSTRMFAVRIALVKIESFVSGIEMIKDPYKANPFGALVKFKSENDITPTMTLIGQDDNNIIHTFGTGKIHEIDVLGLYNQYDNRVYVDCKNNYGTTLRSIIKIRVDYPFFNTMRVNTSYVHGFKNASDELYVVTGGGPFNVSGDQSNPWPGGSQLPEEKIPLGFDQYGKIRWAYNKHLNEAGQIYPIVYNNKKCFVYYVQGSYGVSIDNFDPYIKILEISGEEIAYYPNLRSKGVRRVHHDAIMINDHILAMPETKNSFDECQIIEFDLKTGTVVKRIDLDDIIDPDRPDILNQDMGEDRVHINSLAYSAEDDSYVVSARHQGVIKIRRSATNKAGLVWWITPYYNVGPDYRFSLLSPTNFDGNVSENWNLGQHAASILPNGDIMMFDNHNEPIFDAKAERRISRVVVFRVNEDNMTVTKVNEWMTPQNDLSIYQSSAQMLLNGNVLSGWSTHKRVYETAYPDGRILFQGDFNPSNYRGDIYRFYKSNLYKN